MRTEFPIPTLSAHAAARMGQRRIPDAALAAVLTYGRRTFVRGSQVRAIGRREVERFLTQGIDLRPFEGLQVLLDSAGSQVITAYRSQDFRKLRPDWKGLPGSCARRLAVRSATSEEIAHELACGQHQYGSGHPWPR